MNPFNFKLENNKITIKALNQTSHRSNALIEKDLTTEM